MKPDQYTNQEFEFSVGDGHKLHIWDWGNAKAQTVVIFLHGGPGGEVKDKYKAAFDPTQQRVIFFDQRGCGLSTPYGSLEHNTTPDLVEDISKIADHLGVESFVLHGSSWGSTLALAYAVTYPGRVQALVIGGIFTGSKQETEWLDKGGFKTFYPDAWQNYLEHTPEEFRDNPSSYHFKTVIEGSPEAQKASAYAYETMEGGVMRLDDRSTPEDYDTYDPAGIRIEMYYMHNLCFMPDRHIFDNAHKLTMPVFIVQGRYDMVCVPAGAYELHLKLPNSQLYWTLSGHAVEHEGQNIFKSILANL